MAYERDLLANLYQRSTLPPQTKYRSEQKNTSTWKKTLGWEKPQNVGPPTETKTRTPKRKKIDRVRKSKSTTTILPSKHPWSTYTKKSAIQRKFPQRDHSKAKGEEEIGRNIVNTTGFKGTLPTNAST